MLVAALALCHAQTAAAAAPHARRRLTQASASANSVAGPGETVNSVSIANSQNGELTVSKVSAVGSGPGTTVNCEQEAKSGQVKSKECGGVGASSSWDTAPACKQAASAYKVVYGSVDKRPWGYEEGRSCALR